VYWIFRFFAKETETCLRQAAINKNLSERI